MFEMIDSHMCTAAHRLGFCVHSLFYFLCVNLVLNPLNAELISMCHLLILLGDLTFIGTCVLSISNNMQRYTVYLYVETALRVSGGTSTHHQERIQLYLQNLVFITPLLLTANCLHDSGR
jgi:hypothetical protein